MTKIIQNVFGRSLVMMALVGVFLFAGVSAMDRCPEEDVRRRGDIVEGEGGVAEEEGDSLASVRREREEFERNASQRNRVLEELLEDRRFARVARQVVRRAKCCCLTTLLCCSVYGLVSAGDWYFSNPNYDPRVPPPV